jgi:hypothetical protein
MGRPDWRLSLRPVPAIYEMSSTSKTGFCLILATEPLFSIGHDASAGVFRSVGWRSITLVAIASSILLPWSFCRSVVLERFGFGSPSEISNTGIEKRSIAWKESSLTSPEFKETNGRPNQALEPSRLTIPC